MCHVSFGRNTSLCFKFSKNGLGQCCGLGVFSGSGLYGML